MTNDSETSEQRAGRELRRLRLAQGWSQEETARRLDAYGYDWHQVMIGRIETAQRPLRLNEAVDLADLFGIPLTDLLGSPETPEQAAERTLRREVAERERAVREAEALYRDARARLARLSA